MVWFAIFMAGGTRSGGMSTRSLKSIRYGPLAARRFRRTRAHCRPGLVSVGSGPGMIAIVRFFCSHKQFLVSHR